MKNGHPWRVLLGWGVLLAGNAVAQQTVTGSNIPGAVSPFTHAIHGAMLDLEWKLRKTPDHAKLPEEFRWELAPELITKNGVVYPRELLEVQATGRVAASFVIEKDGTVGERILETKGADNFAHAVSAWLDHLRFIPAQREGRNCRALAKMRFDFQPWTQPGVARYDPRQTGVYGPGETTSSQQDFIGLERKLLESITRGKTKIAKPGELDQPLKILAQFAPVFPRSRATIGARGEAEVEFIVDREGWVRLPRIVSATAPEYGYAAAQAVAQWRFESPRSKGKKVHVRVVVPFEFQRDASKEP